MSIKSEIQRINTNVKNTLSAISKKGVSVPSNANSNNLEGLITQLYEKGIEEGLAMGTLYRHELIIDCSFSSGSVQIFVVFYNHNRGSSDFQDLPFDLGTNFVIDFEGEYIEKKYSRAFRTGNLLYIETAEHNDALTFYPEEVNLVEETITQV